MGHTGGSENGEAYQELMDTLVWAEKAYAMLSVLYDVMMEAADETSKHDLEPVGSLLNSTPPTLKEQGILRRMDAEWEAEGLE